MFLVKNSNRIIGNLFYITNKYGNLTGSQLVTLMHYKGNTQSKFYSRTALVVIADYIIIEYWENEKLGKSNILVIK